MIATITVNIDVLNNTLINAAIVFLVITFLIALIKYVRRLL